MHTVAGTGDPNRHCTLEQFRVAHESSGFLGLIWSDSFHHVSGHHSPTYQLYLAMLLHITPYDVHIRLVSCQHLGYLEIKYRSRFYSKLAYAP